MGSKKQTRQQKPSAGQSQRIMMVAAENGALPGGKVGGVADVIRDLPRALLRQGQHIDVVTPGYQRFSRQQGATLQLSASVLFNGHLEVVTLYRYPDPEYGEQLCHWFIEHPLFAACGEGQIYCHDALEPFATDADKFALFSLTVCHLLVTEGLPWPDHLHLHDWHAALCLYLRAFSPDFRALKSLPAVYTIHNLGIQGVRPLEGERAALFNWFRGLSPDLSVLRDPAHPHCVNLMRLAINLADRVHVVSPTYSQEVLKASDPAHGFIGGEGLEADLQRVAAEGRLVGILNGCEYPGQSGRVPGKSQFLTLCHQSMQGWVGEKTLVSASLFHAQQRLFAWSRRRRPDSIILASIGRLTAQKVGLLLRPASDGRAAIESILERMPKGMLVMVGSGQEDYERRMSEVMRRHDNFLFLCGFSEALADSLYAFCDAFLMPSTYEPCGISQMLALRAGKPCLVNRVGGLADTVSEDNGFVFSGNTPEKQVAAMMDAVDRLLALREQPLAWQEKCEAARQSRFTWDASVRSYLDKLYAG